MLQSSSRTAHDQIARTAEPHRDRHRRRAACGSGRPTASSPAVPSAPRATSTCGPVLWTTWGRDWRPVATPETVVDDLRKGRLAGGTVLLHDSDCTSAPGSWRSALGALPRLAEELEARGLRAGTLGAHGIAS